MPKLISLYIRQVLFGFGLSAAFVALLLFSNVANLWHLVSTSPMGWIAVFMLFWANGIVFAGVQFAITVMRLEARDDQSGGGRKAPEPVLQPVAIPVER
ncbi:MAG TPA: hypothetical protein ENJ52_13955 [Aliiroseovarius sp.]|nr:hypothetical protein [Aliiroseovarius sp.]